MANPEPRTALTSKEQGKMFPKSRIPNSEKEMDV